MIFQGTVLGPPLWNLFFEDARIPIQKSSFKEIVFADDLNAYKRIKRAVRNTTGFKYGRMCQHALHKWGEANNVTFDPKKESMSIISRESPEGDGFKMLGVIFDTSLYMTQAVLKLSEVANWKVRTILRTKRYYNRDESMNLYKNRVLGFIEYRTAAIYHCAENLLQQIDLVQQRVCNAM